MGPRDRDVHPRAATERRAARPIGGRRGVRGRCGAFGLAALFAAGVATAADHRDSPSQNADPQADINDIYAFMNPGNAEEMILVMTVVRNAQPGDVFSTTITHDYLIESFGNPTDDSTSAGQQRLSCVFPTTAQITCTLGDLVVSNPVETATDGTLATLTPAVPGGMRVWAGLRDDPFFFNAQGLRATFGLSTTADPQGDGRPPQPRFEEGVTSNQLAGPMATANAFFREDTLSIVIGVDRSLLNAGQQANVLKIWALTATR